MEETEILNEIVRALEENGMLQFIDSIYLFGSRARGDAEPRSDFDIAIFSKELSQKNWLDILDIIDNIETLYKIDVVHFECSSSGLRKNILQEGKEFYGKH